MSITLLLGLGIVIVAAIALVPMIFTAGSEPATSGGTVERGSAPAPEPTHQPLTIRVPDRVSTRPTWPERIRGIVGLALFTVGTGAATAVAVGLVVLVIGLALQH